MLRGFQVIGIGFTQRRSLEGRAFCRARLTAGQRFLWNTNKKNEWVLLQQTLPTYSHFIERAIQHTDLLLLSLNDLLVV